MPKTYSSAKKESIPSIPKTTTKSCNKDINIKIAVVTMAMVLKFFLYTWAAMENNSSTFSLFDFNFSCIYSSPFHLRNHYIIYCKK